MVMQRRELPECPTCGGKPWAISIGTVTSPRGPGDPSVKVEPNRSQGEVVECERGHWYTPDWCAVVGTDRHYAEAVVTGLAYSPVEVAAAAFDTVGRWRAASEETGSSWPASQCVETALDLVEVLSSSWSSRRCCRRRGGGRVSSSRR